ncbi:homocysteine S-methyltransferase family protein [Pelagibacterales bacterium SAG-MED11]|nr:homocysteine S-methyltransferase family protein [Pelagibacterales bacterium SAG-MED11]
MDKNFFKTTRILDGGMGQELLSRGMKPKGTLWSASALLDENYHDLLLNAHLDYIKAGAEVIVTNTFATRRIRLAENKVEHKLKYLNTKAGEIAKKTKDDYPNILIAGGLPPQNSTYKADDRSEDIIKDDFYNQAKLIDPFIDFFYFDVLSSIKEINIATQSIEEFNKPYLIGVHISEGTKLPSGEKISELIDKLKNQKLLGVILSCVSPENYKLNLNEIKSLGVPFGFKLNGYLKTLPLSNNNKTSNKNDFLQPNEFLGKRKDLSPNKMLEFVKEFKDSGATILGGCCETSPAHIESFASLK